MQSQRMCPYCHGGNAPNAAQCQWCGHYLQTGSRRVWGWLLIFAGVSSLVITFLAFMVSVLDATTGTGTVPFMGAGVLVLLVALVFILPGVLLLRRKT